MQNKITELKGGNKHHPKNTDKKQIPESDLSKEAQVCENMGQFQDPRSFHLSWYKQKSLRSEKWRKKQDKKERQDVKEKRNGIIQIYRTRNKSRINAIEI